MYFQVGQAKIAFESRDFTKFESLLLRAQRPELAVKQYRDQVEGLVQKKQKWTRGLMD